ncbi:Predicted membrane protein, contains DoH and Cytochrome b-561/ferric reductase transmembrane domains [Phaffia rhodozyma]|uniref:Predicted membrane protein, contains DoH and Cytochrome b-561/ferric reductase transmembrane domains n=1 Tax=Phaffia rhodozyma TaxID=264483 RepID=A0A0F7SLC1_PHARH|nr:Predicted membrane protein, contains DoH and Cytochrome b-561/ferric reductase transmembrane domains [Phaffia rhodozyma]
MRTYAGYVLSIILTLTLVATVRAQSLTGDQFCNDVICVEAIKSSTKTTYTLKRSSDAIKDEAGFGWIAIGFGTTMANSPMVIAWPNTETNSVTISSRQANSHVQPSVLQSTDAGFIQTNATLQRQQTKVNGSDTVIVFSVPDTGDRDVRDIIWAYSSVNPDSTLSSASLAQHDSFDTDSLNLAQVVSSPTTSTASSTEAVATAIKGTGLPAKTTASLTPLSSTKASASSVANRVKPFNKRQKLLITHGTLGGVAMMVFVPLGVLVARLLRVFYPWWIQAHWIIHITMSAPLLIAAIAISIHTTTVNIGNDHFFSTHRQLGLTVFIIFWLQIILGAFIHWRQPSSAKKIRRKSIYNWFHPFLGVTILILGWATVWTGFGEWDDYNVGRHVGWGVKGAWVGLVVLFALAYLIGLLLLRRQFNSSNLRAGSSLHSLTTPITISSPIRSESFPLDKHPSPTYSAERVGGNTFDSNVFPSTDRIVDEHPMTELRIGQAI